MNKSKKTWVIIGCSLTVVGLFIFIGAMAALKFDFNMLNTAKYVSNTYEADGFFNKISIDTNIADVILVPSDDEKCRVVCYEQERLKHSVTVKDQTLIIDTVDNRKWYEHIGISFGKMEVTVYLPHKEYASILIDSDTGDIDIPRDFSFENIRITGATGDVTLSASASNSITIRVSTGTIAADNIAAEEISLSTATGNINISSAETKGLINAETNTGRIKLADVACTNFTAESDTGNISLKNVKAADSFSIKSSTGDVKFESSDAGRIYVKTSTGDVTGTLLSEKVFITDTSTGDVSVPKSVTGGECEIITSTGDIEINIQ